MRSIKPLLLGVALLVVPLANAISFRANVASASGIQPSSSGNWSVNSFPDPAGFSYGSLGKIACPTANSCQAVGFYSDSNNHEKSLIGSYDGNSWSLAPNNDPPGSDGVSLQSISCVSATFCQAVGQFQDSGHQQHGLIYSYDGTSWTPSASPTPPQALYTTLTGVDCVSTTFCQAVGFYQPNTGTDTHPIVVTYDGTNWSVVTAQDPVNTDFTQFYGVDCVSTTFCQAVGFYRDFGGIAHTLNEAFDGTSWSILASSDPITTSNSVGLTKVTCVSTTFCQAIGSYMGSDFTRHSLTKSFDGTAWTTATIANSSSDVGSLNALRCLSTTFCQAVGAYDDANGVSHVLVQTFNSTAWSKVTVPEPSGSTYSRLDAISCVSTTDCQALGTYTDVNSTYHGLAESYDGANWRASTGLEPQNFRYTNTSDMMCTSTSFCQAVGNTFDQNGNYHTLLGSYTTSMPSSPNSSNLSTSGQSNTTTNSEISSIIPDAAKALVSRPSTYTATTSTTDDGIQPTTGNAATSENVSPITSLDHKKEKTADIASTPKIHSSSNWLEKAIAVTAILTILAIVLRVYKQKFTT